MKAIYHKTTGKWLTTDESDEYILTDERIPFINPIGTDEEILDDIEMFSDGEFKADELRAVDVVVLTENELESKLRDAFEAGWAAVATSESKLTAFNDWRNRK